MLLKLKKYSPFITLSLAVIIIQLFINQVSSFSIILFGLIILIGGLPHGALDFYILRNIFKKKIFFLSLIVYVLIAVIFYLLFFIFPKIVFIFFLIYSAFHFGDSDFNKESQVSRLSWGTLIICIPLLIDKNNAEWFLNIFLNNLVTLNGNYLIGIIILSLLLSFSSRQSILLKLLLLCIYAITCLLSNIFYGFAAYFAGLHSVNHFKEWRSNIKNNSLIGLVLITILSGFIVVIQLTFELLPYPNFLTGMNEEIIYNIIILIGSLTVPHMILINRAESLKNLYR